MKTFERVILYSLVTMLLACNFIFLLKMDLLQKELDRVELQALRRDKAIINVLADLVGLPPETKPPEEDKIY